jgi:hypothetical protein
MEIIKLSASTLGMSALSALINFALNMIQEQENELFKVVRNEENDCFDIVLKKPNYQTSTELLGIVSWLHQLGVNEPKTKIRIGAEVEDK